MAKSVIGSCQTFFYFTIICRDYQKEYEKLRDEKFSVSAKAAEEKLTKIKEQGPGSVVELNSLVTGVNFNLFGKKVYWILMFFFVRSYPVDVTFRTFT